MLKEVIHDAIERGERLKKDIVSQILKSAALNDLISNRKFTQTVARVIQTKDEISRSIHRNVLDCLRVMKIPSKEQIAAYEKRVEVLERRLDSIGRDMMKKRLQRSSRRRAS